MSEKKVARVTGNECPDNEHYATCPNMKGVEGDFSMESESFECKKCGKTMRLYYDEMR